MFEGLSTKSLSVVESLCGRGGGCTNWSNHTHTHVHTCTLSLKAIS